MVDKSFLSWPFFEERHRAHAQRLEAWCAANLPVDHGDVDAACRELVARLGRDGWLKPTAVDPADPAPLDVRTLCITRETLARHDGLADFAFAMQGLGTGAISLYGTPDQQRWLERTRAGTAIAAFALSEPRSGSDVAHMEMTAERDGDHYVLEGEKTWISNGGIADFYVVFARTGEAPGAKGISAFLVPADTPGLSFGPLEKKMGWRMQPTRQVILEDCRVPAENLLGGEGEGFRIAMAGLDGGRLNIAACSLGGAQAAHEKALAYAGERAAFGQPLNRFQALQFKLADMETNLAAARTLLYTAAARLDAGAPDATKWSAMAKRFVTDACFEVANQALQLHGGYGYLHDYGLEKLVRDLRVHQILEGTNEIMRVIIARHLVGR